jgi:mono/diheme cytochrome c family protein
VTRRTWMLIVIGMALSIVLGACGGGDLAEDLTPIPTLPPGEEPALIDALQSAPATEAPAEDTGDEGGEGDLVAQGEELFVAACAGCHGAEPGAGPALVGMADRAASRVEGQSAEEYLHESIVDPGAFVVEGYSNIMPGNYGNTYSDTELDAMVAYIMAEGGGEPAAEAEPTEEAAAEPTEAPTEEPTEEPAEEPTEEPEGEATEAADAGAEAVPGDPEAGATVFNQACSGCHGAAAGAGPSLAELKANAEDHAAEHGEGQTVVEFLHESIVDPSAFIAPGFNDGIMPKTYGDQYSDDEIDDMVAYILAQ